MTPSGEGSNRVEIVTIGDELLLGFTVDTNAAYLARRLADVGVGVARRATVGDDPAVIASAVGEALSRTGAVITTGGLGPTGDDRTKPAIAALFGRGMHTDADHLAWMRQRWLDRFARPMPESNVNQAMIPDGSTKLANAHGSAPGVWIEDDAGRWVAMLPGVPREMRGMLDDVLLPRVQARATGQTVVRSRTLRTTGVAESLLADWIEAAPAAADLPGLAYLPSVDGVDLRVTVRGLSAQEADVRLAAAMASLRDVVGAAAYGQDDADLAAVVVDRCRERGLSIAVAESCTGGLLGARLTAHAGASDVIRGGVIAYHDEVKVGLLGVDPAVIGLHGAVSEPVVRQMAAGVRRVTGASIGLGITGIAGPGGGTTEKPVGTVWIAVDGLERVETRLLRLWGDRKEIRRRAAQSVLDVLRRSLVGT